MPNPILDFLSAADEIRRDLTTYHALRERLVEATWDAPAAADGSDPSPGERLDLLILNARMMDREIERLELGIEEARARCEEHAALCQKLVEATPDLDLDPSARLAHLIQVARKNRHANEDFTALEARLEAADRKIAAQSEDVDGLHVERRRLAHELEAANKRIVELERENKGQADYAANLREDFNKLRAELEQSILVRIGWQKRSFDAEVQIRDLERKRAETIGERDQARADRDRWEAKAAEYLARVQGAEAKLEAIRATMEGAAR